MPHFSHFKSLIGAVALFPLALMGVEPRFEDLATSLPGSYSSKEQARGNQNFQDATLSLVRFWADRTDGIWLYAEQALSVALRHPYKQTVYRLSSRDDGTIECHFYDLLDPIAATGAWKDATIINNFTLENLRYRENCLVILRPRPDGTFHGATEGKGCANLRGAAYATMEMTLSPTEITLWERGYRASGAQVWGSVHGGYIFKRSE